MSRDTSNGADIIDIRDIIERYEEMEGERADLEAATHEDGDEDTNTEGKKEELAEWDADNGDEFKGIQSLLSDLVGRGGDHDWRGDWYPVTLIADSRFTDAMQELCQDIGDLPKEMPGYLVIDWDATADNHGYNKNVVPEFTPQHTKKNQTLARNILSNWLITFAT